MTQMNGRCMRHLTVKPIEVRTLSLPEKKKKMLTIKKSKAHPALCAENVASEDSLEEICFTSDEKSFSVFF